MKWIWTGIVAMIVLGASCTKQEKPEQKRWTSSLPLEPPDWSTPEGRVAWSNAVDALRKALVEQESKVGSMRHPSETNVTVTPEELDKQERILVALRKRLEEELANQASQAIGASAPQPER